MTTATEEKKDAVLATSKYFDALAEMVPAKYFIDSGKVNETGSQFWHSKSVKAQKKQEAARAGKIRKRQKFDPEQAKSTTEAQKEVFENKSRASSGDKGEEEDMVDEGNLQFQKLEFNVEKAGSDEAKVQRKKTKQVLLKEAIKKKARAAEDGGNEVAWEDAFNRADGKKVFDDPKKLSKAIKREKKQKEKKTAKWKEIEENQKAKRDEKQKKRKANLKERTAGKIQRKIARKQSRK